VYSLFCKPPADVGNTGMAIEGPSGLSSYVLDVILHFCHLHAATNRIFPVGLLHAQFM